METFKLLSQAVKEGGVLATIVRVEGSAYRKAGAMMLITSEGEQIGMISASCLEADVVIRAMQLLENNKASSAFMVYDMSAEDDLAWGRGAGCNGKIHVLLEKVDKRLRISLQEILHLLKQRANVTIYKDLRAVPNPIRTTYVAHHRTGVDKQITTDMCTDFVHTFPALQRLIVFGAGPDSMPLLQLANQVGFDTYVWDWRPEQFVQAGQYAELLPDWQQYDYHPDDYIVVMTHDFQHDTEILHYLLNMSPFRYIGVLGPRKRLERLLGQQEIPAYLHNPIGLSIGAEGAVEIAISIVAELIHIKRQEVAIGKKGDWHLFSSREEC